MNLYFSLFLTTDSAKEPKIKTTKVINAIKGINTLYRYYYERDKWSSLTGIEALGTKEDFKRYKKKSILHRHIINTPNLLKMHLLYFQMANHLGSRVRAKNSLKKLLERY